MTPTILRAATRPLFHDYPAALARYYRPMRKPIIAIIAAVVVAAGVLVIDPMNFFGGPDWQYGETEMRAAVEGTWELSITDDKGESKTWVLAIKQSDKADRAERSGLVRSAAACGGRTFVRSAHACSESSQMPIEITVLEGDKVPASGRFYVEGETFIAGGLDVNLGKDPMDYRNLVASASARIDPSGKVVDLYATTLNATKAPKATLVRTKR